MKPRSIITGRTQKNHTCQQVVRLTYEFPLSQDSSQRKSNALHVRHGSVLVVGRQGTVGRGECARGSLFRDRQKGPLGSLSDRL